MLPRFSALKGKLQLRFLLGITVELRLNNNAFKGALPLEDKILSPKIIQVFVMHEYPSFTAPALTVTCLFKSNFWGPSIKVNFSHLMTK